MPPERRDTDDGGPIVKPTVYDVAASAGVSIATVSRVLRRPDDVLEATRERVANSIRELGYVPSAAARGLADRRTGIIGLLLPAREDDPDDSGSTEQPEEPVTRIIDDRLADGENPSLPSHFFMDEVVRGAEGEIGRRGLGLLIAAGRPGDRGRLVQDMAGRVDALIVVSDAAEPTELEQVARRIPIVLAAGDRSEHRFDSVAVANHEGMHALVSTVLRSRNPERVLYLAGGDSPDERGREKAFDDAVAAAGASVRVERRVGDFSEHSGRELAAELVALDRRGETLPDLVVCAGDHMALGVMAGLAAAGIDVPSRVAVTGFDGIPAGGFSHPRLTTVHQPMSDLGRLAVSAAVERLEQPRSRARSVLLPVRILLRESCPPAGGV